MQASTRSAAGLAFWGLMFVVFDLHLGRFDVLSDPIGAAMCLAALGRLQANSPHDDRAAWQTTRLWWVLAVFATGVTQLAVLGGLVPHDTASMADYPGLYAVRPTAVVSLLEVVLLPAQFTLIARFRAVAWTPRLTASWDTSRRLLLAIGAPVTIAAALMDLYMFATGRWVAWSLESGAASLALIPLIVVLAASLHLLVSLHRTGKTPDLEPTPAA
jgi:hypothetical protein